MKKKKSKSIGRFAVGNLLQLPLPIKPRKMWSVKKLNHGGGKVAIVLPEDDIAEHDEPGFVCPCRPKVERRPSRWPLIIHNSFDGRELNEPTVC